MLPAAETVRSQPLMRPYALLYLYRRRLRVHGVQEMLAGLGVAVAVALILATLVSARSVAGSAREVVRTVVGPAQLQLHSRSPEGIPESMLQRVERLPGVRQAAPLLEQTATVESEGGRAVTVDLAGADTSLVVLDGLGHTLPRAALSAGGIGLSRQSAGQLGIASDNADDVWLKLRGAATRLHVSAVLGPEAFGALSQALVAVMPLEQLQRLAGMERRISRVLVASRPGRLAEVRRELRSLASGRVDVAAADQDVALLDQALRPSAQASAFFATVSGLLGVLFAFTALLLTVPERRRAVADLRLIGVKSSAIAQMLLFQALALGVLASLLGLAAGYLLAVGAFHQSTAYLAEAFTLGTHTIVGDGTLALAAASGVLAACVASAMPLLDLRRGRALDAVYYEREVAGDTLSHGRHVGLAAALACLAIGATTLFAADRSLALEACVLLALAAVLAIPLALEAVLRGARALAERFQRLTLVPVALGSLRATALRSLALAATGALALFGAVALGGARADLLHGIEHFAHSYSRDAAIWLGTPGDNQATVAFEEPAGLRVRLERISGVSAVTSFQGGFIQLGDRRAWLIARPPSGERQVLQSQLLEGSAPAALARLGRGGWVVVSGQIAQERHVAVGDQIVLPTPSGPAPFRVAATSTNLAWSPGAVFVSSVDYRRLWKTATPTALALSVAPGADVEGVRRQVQRALGPGSGLQAVSAAMRERRIDSLTSEGLGQLGEISTLLLIAAILAMAAALSSAIWQRRRSLAALRLSGVRPARLRAILLIESALMLSAGYVTGAFAGIYGQVVIDGYLRSVTGFPVTSFSASLRPLEMLALVSTAVLTIVLLPGWLASRVSPTLAFDE